MKSNISHLELIIVIVASGGVSLAGVGEEKGDMLFAGQNERNLRWWQTLENSKQEGAAQRRQSRNKVYTLLPAPHATI